MWFSVVCTLINNDTRHNSRQNVVDSRGAATKTAISFSLALRFTTYLFYRSHVQYSRYLPSSPNKYDEPPISRRRVSLQTKGISKPKRILFITTFSPLLPHISNIIKKHYNLLHSSNRCKNVSPHLPGKQAVVGCRRSPNLRDLLVTAKISSNSSNPNFILGLSVVAKTVLLVPIHFSRTYSI